MENNLTIFYLCKIFPKTNPIFDASYSEYAEVQSSTALISRNQIPNPSDHPPFLDHRPYMRLLLPAMSPIGSNIKYLLGYHCSLNENVNGTACVPDAQLYWAIISTTTISACKERMHQSYHSTYTDNYKSR